MSISTSPPQVQTSATVAIIAPGPQAARLVELATVCDHDELPAVMAVLRRVVTPAAYRRLRADIERSREAA